METNKKKNLNDLSIYEESEHKSKELWVAVDIADKSKLQTLIKSVRQSICSSVQQAKKSTGQFTQYFDHTQKLAETQLTQLRNESTILPKVVFISLSTMGGFLVGFRRSNSRKIFLSGVLGVSSTALVFPNEAKFYTAKASEFVSRNFFQIYRTYVWPENQRVKTVQSADEVKFFNAKDKVLKLGKEDSDLMLVSSSRPVGDKGMSKDEDNNMYTTRSK